MTTPVLNFGKYTVCFEAQDEEMSARYHFIKECGWSEKQFKRIEDFPFFCACVSIWKHGEELATDYLGCCSYKTESEFYTRYKSDYFADMVDRCIEEINDPELSALYAPWAESMRKENTRRQVAAKKAWEKRQARKGATA